MLKRRTPTTALPQLPHLLTIKSTLRHLSLNLPETASAGWRKMTIARSSASIRLGGLFATSDESRFVPASERPRTPSGGINPGCFFLFVVCCPGEYVSWTSGGEIVGLAARAPFADRRWTNWHRTPRSTPSACGNVIKMSTSFGSSLPRR